MSSSIAKTYSSANINVSDSNKVDIIDTNIQLKLQSSDVPFIETFDNDTGFIYDSAYSEFSGGRVQQKDQRPANTVIAASFTSSMTANYAADGFSNLAANLNGSPSLSSGKLLCDYAVNSGQNGIYYSDSIIGGLSGNWVAKFKYTPQYSTSPPENINIFTISQLSGNSDQILILHSPTGNSIRVTANGLSASAFDTWEPTASQEYVFEVFCISNQVTLWIDGVQLGTTKTITPSQGTDSVRVWLGAYATVYNVASGRFDDFILYNTASQDELYSFPETIYAATNVIMPEMEHTGDGSILSFVSLVTTENGSVRYTLQVAQSGNYLYWDGAMWSTSDGTYAQATDVAAFNTEGATLPIVGEKYGQFQIHFTSSNTQGYVDILTITLLANIGYVVDNPWIEPTEIITIGTLDDFVEIVTKSGLDDVRWALYKDGTLYYVTGGVWTVADGTYANSNSVSEILAYKSSFVNSRILFSFRAFLHSEDGTTTPILSSATLYYFVTVYYFIKVGYSFNNYTPLPNEWGHIVTADDMRYTYMYGIDAIAADIDETPWEDSQFNFFVDDALADFEKFLNIDIRKRIYKTDPADSLVQNPIWQEGVDYTDEEEPYDFDMEHWQQFGFVALNHFPVISIERAILRDPVRNQIMDLIDKNWLRLDKEIGIINLFPKSGYSYGPYSISNFLYRFFGGNYNGGFVFDYTTGYKNSDFVPRDLRSVVAKYAAIKALASIGDGLLAGFSSSSVSLDGLSESFSSTQSATSAYFGARILQYQKEITEWIATNKMKHGRPSMGFVGGL